VNNDDIFEADRLTALSIEDKTISTQANSKSQFFKSITVNSKQEAMKVNVNRQSLQKYAGRTDGNIYNLSSVNRNTYLDFMEDQVSNYDLHRLSTVNSQSRFSLDDIQLSLEKIPISTLESKVYQLFHRFFSESNSDVDCPECPV
jgi:hypothetical protein